jgi:hypothetical protein
VLSDKDGSRLLLMVDAKSKRLVLRQMENGKGSVLASADLPKHLDIGAWHVIRVEKESERLRVQFDEMTKIDERVSIGGGRFGFIADGCKASFGWCGYSNLDGDGIEKARPKKES